MQVTKKMTVPRNRLLYDEARLENVRQRLDEMGIAPKPTEIKRHVKTEAHVNEIRTAISYWFGGTRYMRTNKAILNACEAIEQGEWALNQQDEIVYADEVRS